MYFCFVFVSQESRSSSSPSTPEEGVEDRVVIKKIRYADPTLTSPSSFLASNGYEPLHLPTKKRLPFLHQYSDEDQYGNGPINNNF
jgi:hypothetical protein